MKKLAIISFCSLLIISSCTCNDNKDGEVDVNDTLNAPIANEPPAEPVTDGSAGSAGRASLSDAEFKRLFDLDHYTNEQVREYRRLHDELDWGTVAGFYPEGSTRPLTESDTKFLTKWGHAVMLNEIYARHGMTFEDEDLRTHFAGQDWYRGNRSNVQSMLTEQEKQNIAFLMNNQPK